MKKTNFNNAIRQIKEIRMTAEEKRAIYERIIGAPGAPFTSHKTPVKSPYVFLAWVSGHRATAVVATVLVLVVVTSGSLAYAAGGSLPGDKLYAIKVGMIEPVRLALARTSAEKARLLSDFSTTRLAEAETLARAGRLDTSKRSQITQLLSVQTVALAGSLKEVKRAAPVEADDISVNFQASMDAHAGILDSITTHASLGTSTTPGQNSVATVTSNVIPVMFSTTTISAVARTSAEQVRNIDDDEENGQGQNASTATTAATLSPATVTVTIGSTTSTTTTAASASTVAADAAATSTATVASSGPKSKHQGTRGQIRTTVNRETSASSTARRQAIQALILQASTTIDSVGTGTTPVEQSIIDQTRQSLDQATRSLNQAETDQSNGNTDEAYSSLLHSEKSAREAGIYIQAGLDIHGSSARPPQPHGHDDNGKVLQDEQGD